MHVTVDTEGGAAAVGLDQPEDCTRFDVVVRGTGHAAAVDAALRGAGAGELDGEGEALVGVAWVR
ncbi:MAG TPA: hypothetical protein VMB72_11365, partial [Acidimicrobiales bacterium]|nr:hypothetical protein [Acidimicrobiales bacterium]